MLYNKKVGLRPPSSCLAITLLGCDGGSTITVTTPIRPKYFLYWMISLHIMVSSPFITLHDIPIVTQTLNSRASISFPGHKSMIYLLN